MFKDFEKHYPNTNTTELLKMLNSLRCIEQREIINANYPTQYLNNNESSKLYIIIINAIKKELAKREHIPNKKERKTIRQLKYKSQFK